MKAPVITPTADDIKPCDGRAELFLSTAPGDHAQARLHCRGSKKLGIPGCPFIGWCRQERQAFQETEYRGGLHGTWHGVLFVERNATNKRKRREEKTA